MEGSIKLAVIGAGGALGAIVRHVVNISPLSALFQSFPFATFLINVTGSFAIGFATVIFAEKYPISENARAAIMVGFLGAFTTFSTFEVEIFELVKGSQGPLALLYVVSSVVIGFVGVIAGANIASRL